MITITDGYFAVCLFYCWVMSVCCSIRGRILEEEGAYVMICGCSSLLCPYVMA